MEKVNPNSNTLLVIRDKGINYSVEVRGWCYDFVKKNCNLIMEEMRNTYGFSILCTVEGVYKVSPINYQLRME